MKPFRRCAPWRVAAAGAVVLCLGLGCASLKTTVQPAGIAPLDPQAERRTDALAHYATGVSLELAGNADAALAEYRAAFELDPGHVTLALRLANVYLNRREPAKAIELLEAASKANAKLPDLWVALGLAYRAADQTPQAVTAFREAQKLEPAHLGVVQALLEIYLRQDAMAEAGKVLDQAWRQPSKDAVYWVRLGDLHAAAFREKSGLDKHVARSRIQQCYEKAQMLSADNPDVLLRLGELYAEAGDSALAAETYAKVLQLRPSAVQVRDRLAALYVRAGQKEKAVELLEEIVRADPLRFQVYNLLGNLYEDLDRDERAISNYRQSMAVNADQLEPILRLALLEAKAKRFAEALKLLAAAEEKFPDVYQVPYFLALTRSDQKEYRAAVEAFGKAAGLAAAASEEPQPDSTFYFYYGSACERTGDLDKAAMLFKKSLELNPENHAAANYLGYMWADKGVNLPEAHELIRKAIAHEPDNGAYLDSLGWVLFRLDRPEEALPHLQRAAELTKDDPVVFEHLADVLLKLGYRDEAIAQLRRGVEADRSNKELAEKLQRLTGP